ncbi:hypothetical protein EJB05_14887, partial [Eragrostis curvula]
MEVVMQKHGKILFHFRFHCQDPPNANFIPLPLPLPGNKDKLRTSLRSGHSPRLFRDIACVDSVLKFIEVENRVIDMSSDPSDKGLLYDSDLIMSLKRKDMDEKPRKQHSGYGRRAVTWRRMILSNCWHKERTIDVSDISAIEVSDILASESTYSSLPSGLQAVNSLKSKLYSAFPTFSVDGDDIFYLKSMVEPNDRDGWVVAVDLENKIAKAFGAWSFAKRGHFSQAFRSCTLSNHLKMTPGIKASAYRKITQAGSCADDPNKTPPPQQSISNWNRPHNNEYQPLSQQPTSSQQQQMPNQLWNS